jgi:hypothetical protein
MTNIGNSPALNFNFSSSVNTRQFFQTLQVPGASVPGSFNSTFQLDPNCPFFRIFAGSTATSNTFISSFQFSLGGTPCGGITFQTWGGLAYDSSPGPNLTSGLLITPFFGSDVLELHSQYAASCAVISGSNWGGENYGYITRWTALADSLYVVTAPVSVAVVELQNVEVVHGVIQAPW